MDLALQAVYKWASARVRIGMRRVAKEVRMEERTLGIKAVARKKAKGKSKAARERPESVGRAARQDTLQLGAGKEETKTCTPQMKKNEQWKKVNQASLLSVESSLSPMKIVEVKHKRGNPEVQNIQKCECCQTLHFNAKGRPSWKHCGAG